MTDMRGYAERGWIDRTPSYNSLFDYLANPILTPILKSMIEESARPLKSIESEFAVDSTGFSSSVYQRWFDHKYGRVQSRAEFVKAHAMVGVTTNVVTSVEATPSFISDYKMLSPLLKTTAAHFNVAKLSADKAYSGVSNVEAIAARGAMPLIAFKVNATRGKSGPWQRSFDYFQEHQEAFYKQYHQRSNVETTFSMIKTKFGGFVRSKTATAQINEVLCKVLAHNLCVLVQAFFEFGLTPTFWESGRPALVVVERPEWMPNLPPRMPWSLGKASGRPGPRKP